MKVMRYRLSGRTQRNGTTATSRQSWFVVARRSAEPHADKPSHSASSTRRGFASAGVGPVALAIALRGRARVVVSHAVYTQARAKAAKPTDHPQPWCSSVSMRSTRNGYESSPSNEPTFDTA